jgi:tetratricopeptide (TPR) repeat protein
MAQTDFTDMLETAREQFRQGHYHVAESLLQQLMISDTQNPEIHHMLATIYYDQGKFNKAIRTFRRALEIDPAFTDASVGLSIILNDIGRYEEGKKVFMDAQEALNRRNHQPDAYLLAKIATKLDELGELYFQAKNFREAIEQYEKALSLSRRKAELKMKVVECHLHLEDTARAQQELRALIQEFPQFTPARLKLGMIHYNGGQVIEAVEQWEGILMRDPEHPTALQYLKMAQETRPALLY